MKKSAVSAWLIGCLLTVGGTAWGATVDVQIINMAFSPASVKIAVGDTVRWTNNDGINHTSTSGQPGFPDAVWNSGILAPGASFSFTFNTAGNYAYFCTVHPFMTGLVQVVMSLVPGEALAGDFDGDGKADPANYLEINGLWQIMLSGNGYAITPFPFGGTGYIPVAGDYDGDGKADPALYDSSSGNWQVGLSGSGYNLEAFHAGDSVSTPVAGDFDGDGKADPAVVDLIGEWYVWLSGQAYSPVGPIPLNSVTGTVLAADFDGDGKADPAVVDLTGHWYVWFSSQSYARGGPAALNSVTGAVLAADFDGDGKADPAVVDPTGHWYAWFSGQGYARAGPLSFTTEDIPGVPIAFDVMATNLTSPTVLTHAGDGSQRLFIAEQTGKILIVDSNQTLLPTPFLDLSNKMTNLAAIGVGGYTNNGLNPFYDERGLLGLAFHPGYATNGRFFVYYSSPKTAPGVNHESILAAYTVSTTNPNLADAASEQVLLQVDEPEFNHNGGSLAFGPADGYLYVALGDGGGAGDAHGTYGNGQNITNLLGKILRLDVDSGSPYAIPTNNPFAGAPGADEIYAYGFRNPWKLSFDRGGSNALMAADVGQNLWEEIDNVRKGGNYGWRIMEGRHGYDLSVAGLLGINFRSLDYPIHEYTHGPLGIAAIGGFVYRGTNYPSLAGRYVFGDFSTSFGAPDGAVYYLTEARPGVWQRYEFQLPGGGRLGRFVKGFGEDQAGELYLLSTTILGPTGTSGDVRKLRKP